MKMIFAATVGLLLVGSVGATQLDAQRISIRKGNKSVTIDNDRHNSRSTRTPVRHDRRSSGHYQIVKKKVWVPGHYDTVTERVWVPGKHVVVRERRRDRCGNIYYVKVRKFVRGHYETCTRRVFHKGHYEVRTEKVWVEDNCDTGHDRRGQGRRGGRR